jgi:uncharacterized protein
MHDPLITDREPQPPAPSYKVRLGPSALTGAGRGVFAVQSIAAGELIESCPVITLPDPNDRGRLRRTGLVNYYFLWGRNRDRSAICLGFGSLYNHAYEPNAWYIKHIDEEQMDFYALTDIAEGEEITVNYNGLPNDKKTLWIKSIPPANALNMDPSGHRSLVRRILSRLGI